MYQGGQGKGERGKAPEIIRSRSRSKSRSKSRNKSYLRIREENLSWRYSYTVVSLALWRTGRRR